MLPITNSHLSPLKKESQFESDEAKSKETNRTSKESNGFVERKEERSPMTISCSRRHLNHITKNLTRSVSPSLHAWPRPPDDLQVTFFNPANHRLSHSCRHRSQCPLNVILGVQFRNGKKNTERITEGLSEDKRHLAKCRLTFWNEKQTFQIRNGKLPGIFAKTFEMNVFFFQNRNIQATSPATSIKPNLISKLPENLSAMTLSTPWWSENCEDMMMSCLLILCNTGWSQQTFHLLVL